MITKLVKELSDSPLFSFSDWPNSQIPKVCAGVYTIYDENECLIYVGMIPRSWLRFGRSEVKGRVMTRR